MTIADFRRGALRVCSFLLVLVIVFCVVAFPLAVPARAVISTTAAGVIWMILQSAGFTLVLDPNAGNAMLNAVVDNITSQWEANEKQVFDLLCEQAESSPTMAGYSQINISRKDYKTMSDAVQKWIDSRVTADGTIKIDVGNAPPILLKKENAYKGSVDSAIKVVNALQFATQTEVKNFLGDSVVVFGNADGFVLDRNYMDSTWSQICVSCDKWGGNGGHYIWASIRPDGTVLDLPSRCTSCANLYPPTSALVFFGEKSAGVYDVFYGTCSSRQGASISGFYNLLRSNAFSTPIEVPGVGSVDVPVEKDKDYAGGVVLGKWDGLIGQVGSAADTLPFNIPMTEGALGTLTPSAVLPKELQVDTSTDVPAEGEIEMPSVDALKLPAGITTKFPFCIPFDLYRALVILNAPPVAPRFVIPLKYGDLVDEEIVLDFQGFEFLISLVRWFEFGLFCVGLAAATRYLIKV